MQINSRTAATYLLIVFAIVSWQSLGADRTVQAGDPASENTQVERSKLVTQKDLLAVLKMPAPELTVKEGSDLNLTLDTIAKSMTKSLGKPVSFFADARELELEGVTSLSDVKLNELNISAGIQTYASQLSLIFRQTNNPLLAFTIEHNRFTNLDGRFEITTLAKALETVSTRIYNVNDLLMDVELVKNDQTGLLARDRGAANLIKLIEQNLQAFDQLEPKGQMIGIHGQYLVVRTTSFGHGLTNNILQQLAESMEEGGTPIVMQSTNPKLTDSQTNEQTESKTSAKGYVGGGIQ